MKMEDMAQFYKVSWRIKEKGPGKPYFHSERATNDATVSLYQSIRVWESANPSYRVLRMA